MGLDLLYATSHAPLDLGALRSQFWEYEPIHSPAYLISRAGLSSGQKWADADQQVARSYSHHQSADKDPHK